MGTGTPMAHGPLASVRLPEKSKMQRIFWSRAPGDPAQWGGGGSAQWGVLLSWRVSEQGSWEGR